MALRKLKAHHIRYICWRVVGENKTNAYLKAFGGNNRQSASVLSTRLEKNNPIIRQEIEAGRAYRERAIQQKREREFRRHQARVEEERAQSHQKQRKDPGYDTSLGEGGLPPSGCGGKTFKGHPIIDRTGAPRRGAAYRFNTNWDPLA